MGSSDRAARSADGQGGSLVISEDGLVLEEEEHHFTPYHFISTWETGYNL